MKHGCSTAAPRGRLNEGESEVEAVGVAVDHPGDGALWSGMRGEMECTREEGQREGGGERGSGSGTETHTHTTAITTIIIMIVPDIEFLERN